MRVGHIDFGFFSNSNRLTVGPYLIVPLDDFAERKKSILKLAREGVIYPPTVHQATLNVSTSESRILPDTDEPAFLFRPIMSHRISRSDGQKIHMEKFRDGEGGLIIQLLALLHRTRLQFEGWYLDGKFRIKYYRPAVFTLRDLEINLTSALALWGEWNSSIQARYITAIYHHNRCNSLTWDWERFFWNYTVIETCWKIHQALREPKGTTRHSDRFGILLEHYGLSRENEWEDRIVALRNELVHEGLWDGGLPGSGNVRSDQIDAYDCSDSFHGLMDRLLLAMLEVADTFTKHSWIKLGSPSLGTALQNDGRNPPPKNHRPRSDIASE